jgi:hypothetical protein
LLYIHPEILDRLVSKPSLNTPETSAIATQGATASESPKRNEVSDLKSIIEKFIIIDGSNVLHWMEDNRQADKVNLIPLVIVLTAIRRKGFDFCCYFDASKIFETREKQPEQFKEFEIILKKYPIYFSVAPGGTSADDFIILDAKNSKRKVLSNDRFRDHPIQLPKNQFIKGAVVNCQIAIPMLNIIESLISDFRKAMRDLESELKK